MLQLDDPVRGHGPIFHRRGKILRAIGPDLVPDRSPHAILISRAPDRTFGFTLPWRWLLAAIVAAIASVVAHPDRNASRSCVMK